jgi:hypothetical protein
MGSRSLGIWCRRRDEGAGMGRTPLLLVSLMLICLATPAHAADITAASCSNADVQTAINSAATGDRVRVPAGSCTWSATVTLANKRLTLQGAGIGQTNITDRGAGAALAVGGASATNFVTITGFTFIKSNNNSNGIVQISGTQGAVAFRVHHIRILQASSGARGIAITDVYGVIDNVIFDVTATGGSIQSVSVSGSSDSTDGGFTPWRRPLTLGTNNAVYIEDSTFTYSNQYEDAVDGYGGARLVIRNNTFNSVSVGFHGTDSGNRRSIFSWEIYNNTFTNNSATTLRGATLRGGTGAIFNNTYGGSRGVWYGFTVMAYRACQPLDQSAWGSCNGTNWQIGSTDFSSDASRTCSLTGGVKFCSIARDTVCTTDSTCSAIGGGTCSTFFDGTGLGGYPCRDQVGRTHNQVLAPIYAWNNGGLALGPYDGGGACGLGLSTYIQSGRDYYDATPMPGYSPYTYPHPLRVSSPAPPTSVIAQ